jgi:hypothetical protein
VAGERVANDQLLDRERLGDVAALECAHDRLRDAEVGKRSDVFAPSRTSRGDPEAPRCQKDTRRKLNLSGGESAKPDPTTVAAASDKEPRSLDLQRRPSPGHVGVSRTQPPTAGGCDDKQIARRLI